MSQEKNVQEKFNLNKEEKHFPEDSHAPKPQTTNISAEDLAKADDKSEKVEVHKHPHHVTHKKKWGEYLLEFLMLFLAVFLGFVAENIREHTVEHKRSNEYAISLVQDLRSDTAAIHAEKKSAEKYIDIADSLLILSKNKLEGSVASRFSFYTRFMYWTQPIIWNRATFEQIKNSGSLRYFKNYRLLEKMMNYEAIAKQIDMEAYNNTIRGNMLLNQINLIIDPEYHRQMSRYYLFSLDTMSVKTSKALLTVSLESLENKRKEIKEMLNMIIVQQRNLRLDIDSPWKQAEELAVELISDLKKEYHLE